MANRLIYGFNVTDAGKTSIGRLQQYLEGHSTVVDVGWIRFRTLATMNQTAVAKLLAEVNAGDVLIGHSNGCWIANQVAWQRPDLKAVVCINPALRINERWPNNLPVLCLHNKKDLAGLAGKLYAETLRLVAPQSSRVAWGSAGRWGFSQASVENWDTLNVEYFEKLASGHSGVFDNPVYWARKINTWLFHLPRQTE